MNGRGISIVSPGRRKRQPGEVEFAPLTAGYAPPPDSCRPTGQSHMKLSIHTLAVEQVTHTLKQLVALLDKGAAYAETKKFDPAVLVGSRLAPDMLPLSRQIQIASDTAKFGVSRLTGI